VSPVFGARVPESPVTPGVGTTGMGRNDHMGDPMPGDVQPMLATAGVLPDQLDR
jgi:hypothetical protein